MKKEQTTTNVRPLKQNENLTRLLMLQQSMRAQFAINQKYDTAYYSGHPEYVFWNDGSIPSLAMKEAEIFGNEARELIELLIPVLEQNSKIPEIAGECLTMIVLFENILYLHPKIEAVVNEDDRQRLVALNAFIDGIKIKKIEGKITRLYLYYREWQDFFKDCNPGFLSIKDVFRIDNIFNMLDSDRRKKIAKELTKWNKRKPNVVKEQIDEKQKAKKSNP